LNLLSNRFPAIKLKCWKAEAGGGIDGEDAIIWTPRNEHRVRKRRPLHPQEGAPYLDNNFTNAGRPSQPTGRFREHGLIIYSQQ
jgi:hypothetical protein